MTNLGIIQRYILSTLLLVLLSPQAFSHHLCRDLKRKYDLPVRLVESRKYTNQLKSIFLRVPNFKLGWIHSAGIFRKVTSLGICINVSGVPLTGSGVRQGSVYFAKEKIIVINQDRIEDLDRSPEKKSLLMHETLGALGYPDENYQLTTFITAKSQEELFGRETIDLMRRELARDLMIERRRTTNIITTERSGEGGISGVGGGGEPEVAVLKPLMISTLLKNNKAQADLIRYILKMRLETDVTKSFELKPTNHQDFFLGDQNGEEFIVIRHGSWFSLQESERTEYLNSLVSLASILEADRAQP